MRNPLTVLLATTALLVGCASKPADTGPKPVVRSIAIVPATLPTYYSLQNLSTVQFFVPIASIGYAMNSKEKAKLLTARLPSQSFRIDEDLTSTLADSLRKMGYEVTVLTDIKRLLDDPDSQELNKLKHTSDAVVHIYFSDVGVLSPRSTTDYLPRMNVSVITYTVANKAYPYESTIYYGADATSDKSYSIEAAASDR